MTQLRPAHGLYFATAGFAFALMGAAGCAKGRLDAAVGQATITEAMGPRVYGEGKSRPGVKDDSRGAKLGLVTASIGRALPSPLTATTPDAASALLLPEGQRPLAKNGLCPPDMASIDDLYCVDKFEASLVEMLSNGEERAWAANRPVEGHTVRAVSERGAVPQGYISEKQAINACRSSGKRLCKPAEWRKACRGPENTKFGYGDEREAKRCNDHGVSPMMRAFGSFAKSSPKAYWAWDKMNDPQLNEMADTVTPTGSHEGCTNGYGVYDMVGNLHEWVDDPAGTFQGGYYLDTHKNGDGCGYRTDAHEAWYHDYSTGFRCCADVGQ